MTLALSLGGSVAYLLDSNAPPPRVVSSATGRRVSGSIVLIQDHVDYLIRNDADVAEVNALGVHTGLTIGVLATTPALQLKSELILVGDDVTVRPSGYGEMPEFHCDDVVTDLFIKDVSETDIWDVTIAIPGGPKCLGNTGYDDTMLRQVATLAALRLASADTSFVVNWSATSTTWRYKSGAGVNPNLDGRAYWWTRRDSGIFITGNRARISTMLTRRNAHQDGSLRIGGTDAYVEACRLEDGARHNGYSGVGATWIDCYFYRGRNDLESPGTANGLVVNQPTITGQMATVTNCIFDGGGLTDATGNLIFTGPYSHGSVSTQVLATFNVSGCTFIDCASGPNACAVTNNITGSTMTRVQQGVGVNNVGTINISGTTAGSTLNVLYKNEVAVGTLVVNSSNNRFSIPDLGGGAAGFYKTEPAGTTTNLTINGDVIDVLGVRGLTTNANRQLIRHRNGNLKINNMIVGPAVCNRAENLIVAGFGGGVVTYDTASNDNQWPVGGQGTLNGTAYTTLAAWKAGTGADAATVTLALPTAVLSDNFVGAAGNLENHAPWVKMTGGAVGALQLNGAGAVNAASGTFTGYGMGDLASSNQCIQFTISGVNAVSGGGPALRIVDVSNALWFRFRSGAFEIAMVLAGVVSQVDSSTTVLPVAGDVVIWALEEVTDPNTGAVSTRSWMYVNNRLLRGMIQITAPALVAEKTVGAVARSTIQAPLFTAVRYSPTRAAA
jgi:hypothetical protein